VARASPSPAGSRPSAPVALRVQAIPSSLAYTSTSRRPASSGAPTSTCTAIPPWRGTITGASIVSSSSRPAPHRRPAASAISTSAVPGTSSAPRTA
jgi:hypothetical protein